MLCKREISSRPSRAAAAATAAAVQLVMGAPEGRRRDRGWLVGDRVAWDRGWLGEDILLSGGQLHSSNSLLLPE